MSLIYVDEDPWIREYEALEAACRDIAIRQAEDNYTATHAADIRIRLRQCAAQLQRLRATLNIEHPELTITPEERERRERGIENLQTRIRKLNEYNSSRGKPNPTDSEALAKQRSLLFGDDDIASETIKIEVKSHDQILQEQDRGLDSLATILARQRMIAQNIGNEVESQNGILDDLGQDITQAAGATEQATRTTSTIMIKDNTCGYWSVIIALFVAIIVVLIL